MKKFLTIAASVASVVAFAPAANAADFLPGTPQFQVSGNIFSGPIAARFGNTGIAAGNFQDRFLFTIPQDGVGSGSLSTTVDIPGIGGATDTDIFSVLVNGIAAAQTTSADGLTQFFSISNVPITFGIQNSIVINGFSRGNASYGGNATFTPTAAIPEPATWAIMLLGFAGIGFGLRYQRRATKVSFS